MSITRSSVDLFSLVNPPCSNKIVTVTLLQDPVLQDKFPQGVGGSWGVSQWTSHDTRFTTVPFLSRHRCEGTASALCADDPSAGLKLSCEAGQPPGPTLQDRWLSLGQVRRSLESYRVRYFIFGDPLSHGDTPVSVV